MFLAATLDSLPDVVGLHEGHTPGDPPTPRLPLINLHNRKSWHDPIYAERTVAELRDLASLSRIARDADVLVDVAFYNAPLLVPLARQHPDSTLFVIFRHCEDFVRSATITCGEDRQPAGWPDRTKPLTDRERFISLGRLKPAPGGVDAEQWPSWTAIQRNVWLWHNVNVHLLRVAESHANCHILFYEDLVKDPKSFWTSYLRGLGLLSDGNLAGCVEQSTKKINQRTSYHVGRTGTWSEAELELYERLARPLEKKLYD